MGDRSNAQIIAEARRQIAKYDDWHLSRPWIEGWQGQIAYGIASDAVAALRAVVAALEAEGRLSPDVQGDAKLPQNSDEREALRGTVLNVLCNASNFPEKAQSRLLGQDMRPLVEKVVDAVLALTPDNWEYAWEADEPARSRMFPRGPRIMFEDFPETPEAIARFPKGRRMRRRPAGPWEPVPNEQEQ